VKKNCSNSVVWTRLFPLDGWFGFTSDVGILNKELKARGAEPEKFDAHIFAKCLHIVGSDHSVMALVCYDRDRAKEVGILPIQEVSLMAHEAVHAWMHLASYYGISIDDSELFAVAVQGFTQFAIGCLDEIDDV